MSSEPVPDPPIRPDLQPLLAEASALMDHARAAAALSYSPYSGVKSGAVISASGRPYSGCRIESAALGVICAEKAAIVAMIGEGRREFTVLTMSTLLEKNQDVGAEFRMPCGGCLQFLSEFAAANALIYVDGVGIFNLKQLLPRPFRLR